MTACWAPSSTTRRARASRTARSAPSRAGPSSRRAEPASPQMTWFLQTAVGGLSIGAVYALVALGFSIVYRTMGLVNFAHADVVMIGAYVTVTFFLTARLPFGVALVLAVLLTGALGLVIERILRPLESKDLNLMLIGTIG